MAASQAAARLHNGGVIVTDCWAVCRTWREALRCAPDNAKPLWRFRRSCREAAHHSGTDVRWMPSHRSYDEAMTRGLSAADWQGNDVADAVAKWAAAFSGPPQHVVDLPRQQASWAASVLKVAGTVLLTRLQARPRSKSGAATKVRKHAAPGPYPPQKAWGMQKTSLRCPRRVSWSVCHRFSSCFCKASLHQGGCHRLGLAVPSPGGRPSLAPTGLALAGGSFPDSQK